MELHKWMERTWIWVQKYFRIILQSSNYFIELPFSRSCSYQSHHKCSTTLNFDNDLPKDLSNLILLTPLTIKSSAFLFVHFRFEGYSKFQNNSRVRYLYPRIASLLVHFQFRGVSSSKVIPVIGSCLYICMCLFLVLTDRHFLLIRYTNQICTKTQCGWVDHRYTTLQRLHPKLLFCPQFHILELHPRPIPSTYSFQNTFRYWIKFMKVLVNNNTLNLNKTNKPHINFILWRIYCIVDDHYYMSIVLINLNVTELIKLNFVTFRLIRITNTLWS